MDLSFQPDMGPQYYGRLRCQAAHGLHEHLAMRIQQAAARGARILDFGAGEGALSQRLCDLGYEVLSVDANTEAFGANCAFEQIDANDPSQLEAFVRARAASFDLAVAAEVLEHVWNPRALLEALRAVVKPGGTIVLSTPNVASWYARMRFLRKGSFPQFGQDPNGDGRASGHVHAVTADELRVLCESAGLEFLRLETAGWLPRLWLNGRPGTILLNVLGFLCSFLMRGPWRGWCLVAVLRKPA